MHQVIKDFDCVHIYKQPALQHPLLKNHKIQLHPTFAMNIMLNRPSNVKTTHECPVGKVPIYNGARKRQIITNSSPKLQIGDFQQYSQSSSNYHTVTLDTTQNMIFHGANAIIAAYNLSLKANQYSMSSIWIASGPPTELNIILTGFGVHPGLYGDSQLRLTSYWTVDGKKTGCYNQLCPGFVQVNHDKENALGSVLSPTTPIGSTTKYVAPIKIKQDRSTSHWWLIIHESIYVGYWPKELFTHLSKGAAFIRFGGQTYAPPNNDSPPMGSGRLPKEKFPNSGLMGELEIIDSGYNEIDVNPEDMKPYTDTNSNCYDLAYRGYQGSSYRQAFLYGGPGGRNCGI
ncbi:carboxyl-terminal peptidase [Medicago truncatula]|uniref:Carboxyl-terminal peptidase n=3 Tax=Medicago truncatula TaxID=3880 RepID=G7L9S1_MEDTR|nr:carboxyl-terminal peptidase [Medicago truncatula]